MSSFEGSVHRLAGSTGNEVGGLVVKKKQPVSQGSGGEESERGRDQKSGEFKKPAPRASMFGLDVLAKRKREEREAREEACFTEKRQKISPSSAREEEFDDSSARVSFGRSTEKQKDRVYRQVRVETPSHTGGVNVEVLQRIQQRLKSDQPPVVGARSRDRDTDKTHRYNVKTWLFVVHSTNTHELGR